MVFEVVVVRKSVDGVKGQIWFGPTTILADSENEAIFAAGLRATSDIDENMLEQAGVEIIVRKFAK